jgi:hypothetical protein
LAGTFQAPPPACVQSALGGHRQTFGIYVSHPNRYRMCVCAFDNAPDRNLEIVVAALAERFSIMNSRSCGMPECAAALSARWYRKNDGQDAELATDAADRGFSSKLPRLTRALHKKTTIRSTNGRAHRGTCHGAPHRHRRGQHRADSPRQWHVPPCTKWRPSSKTIRPNLRLSLAQAPRAAAAPSSRRFGRTVRSIPNPWPQNL